MLDAAEGMLQLPNMFSSEDKERILPELKTKTVAGDISNTITQGALGLIGAGKFLKALELASKAGKAVSVANALNKMNNATTAVGKIGSGAVKGFIGDFTVFDENEERLADVINEIPFLANPFTEYLADREDESRAEGRFKNALEGVGLGALIDSFMVMAKVSKGYMKIKGSEATDRLFNRNMKETVEDVADETINKETKKTVDNIKIDEPLKDNKPYDEVKTVEDIITESKNIKAESFEKFYEYLSNDKRNKKLMEDIDSLTDKLSVDISKIAGSGVNDITEAFSRLTKDSPAWTRIGEENEYLYKTVLNQVKDKIVTKMGWKETIKQTDKLFNQELMSKELRAFLKADSEALNTITPRLLYYRLDSVAKLNKLVKLSEQNLQGKLDDITELTKVYNDFAETISHTQTIMSGLGRALNSLKIKPDKKELENILKSMEESKTPRITQNIKPSDVNKQDLLKGTELEKFVGQDTTVTSKQLKAIERLTEMGADITNTDTQKLLLGMARSDSDSFVRMLSEKRLSNKEYVAESFLTYFTNNLLSSPPTQIFNTAGSLLKLVASPLERIMGGVFTANAGEVMRGIRQFAGYRSAVFDSLKMARLSFKMGCSVLDNSKNYPAINSTRISEDIKWQIAGSYADKQGISQLEAFRSMKPEFETAFKTLGYIGSALQTPLRLMGATDEFFKQMAYRSKVYADSVEEALQNGIADKQRFLAKKLEEAFENGRGINESGLEYARKQTWTQELDSSKWIDRVAIAVKSVPMLRPFVPFVTTPTNLLKDLLEHTPLINKAPLTYIKREYDKGGQALVELEGKAAMGLTLGFAGVYLASEGLITGAYPTKQEERALWETQGRLPFSVRIGDKWIPYNRLDPFGSFFGMAATVYDRGMRTGGDDLSSPFTYLSAVIQNISNKTYLQGIVDLLEGIQNPESPALALTAQNLLSGLMPMSSALRWGARQIDSELKETRGDFNLKLASGLPFISKTVPARNNFITGQPVESSYFYSNAKDNYVLEKLMPYADVIRSGAPSKIIRGVKLTADEFSQLSQLQGTIKIGGKTLMEELTRLTNSYAWKNAENRTNYNGDNIRVEMLQQIFSRYKKTAQQTFLKGNTNFNNRIKEQEASIRQKEDYKQTRFARGINISDL